MSVMWDETSMYVQPEYERAASLSVLDIHADLVCRPCGAQHPHHEAVIGCPTILDNKPAKLYTKQKMTSERKSEQGQNLRLPMIS